MLKSKKFGRWENYVLVTMIATYTIFLFYKVNVFPNVFLDEGNGMYDSWCIANYGVDSNLLKNPIYLPGYIGQGQSILYPFIASFSLRIFGYNILAYRLPILLISILNYCLTILLVRRIAGIRYALLAGLILGTAPYILTVSRWGMDCNIAPFVANMGMVILFYGFSIKQSKWHLPIIYLGGGNRPYNIFL